MQKSTELESIDKVTAGGRSLLDILDKTFQYWALIPALILLTLLTLQPMFDLLRMSVSTIDFVEGNDVWTFSAAKNIDLFKNDWIYRVALKNTLIFVFITVTLEMILGFALALLVSGLSAGKGLVRTIMVLPILVPAVTIGSIWKLMYNFEFGIFNQILTAVGFMPQDWLGSLNLALASVVVVDIWHWTPFVFLVLLAGLEALPVEVFEAAEVDGANRWQLLRYVTIPMMWPAISVALLFRIIMAFKVFDEVFLLTSGGPGTATEVVSLYIYKVFFAQNRLGYGALLSIVTILLICVFIFTYRHLSPGKVVKE
ncbi:MAG: sugar ABC transporter permease [Chloroflexales bacterium]|nr:sugar ABC transporter permease [Chloroflexales bacterium]